MHFGDGAGTPLVGDWDGSGVDKPGLYIPPFFHFGDLDGRTIRKVHFGDGTGTPVVGHWDDSGIDRPGLYIPPFFHFSDMEGRTIRTVQFGGGAGTPLVGDWDGSGVDKPGLYIPPFFHFGDLDGRTIRKVHFGDGTGKPLAGDWGLGYRLVISNGSPTRGGSHMEIRNDSGAGAAVAAGSLVLNFPPGSTAGIRFTKPPATITTWKQPPGVEPVQLGQINVGADELPFGKHYGLTSSGQIEVL